MTRLKTCSSCKLVLHRDEFHRSSRASDGRKSECKACAKEQIDRTRPAISWSSRVSPRSYREAQILSVAWQIPVNEVIERLIRNAVAKLNLEKKN